MVAPVTGPFTSTPVNHSYRLLTKTGYRQKPPYTLPLTYYHFYQRGFIKNVQYNGTSPAVYGEWGSRLLGPGYFSDESRHEAAAYNQAYARLKAQVSDSAGWAENFAQINKTRTMIVDRSVQLARFASALRKGRFNDAARVLRTPRPSGVSGRKAVSQNFLEFEYGIKPIISDLQSSMSILTSDPGVRRVVGSGKSNISVNTNVYGRAGAYYTTDRNAVDFTVAIRCQANVRVTNANLFLANQLGIIDLALPWKLMPFSFVIDWFVNVEQVISSVTDWYGVSLENPFWTRKRWANQTGFSSSLTAAPVYGNVSSFFRTYTQTTRTLGLPSPTLVIKPFKGFSLQRGAQAISLVLAVLGK